MKKNLETELKKQSHAPKH